MVGSEYHGGTGTEEIVSSTSIVALVSAASCVASRLLILAVRGEGGRPRLTVQEVLKENAKVTTDVLAQLVVLAKRRDDKRSAATLDGHGQQQRGAMLFRVKYRYSVARSTAVKE